MPEKHIQTFGDYQEVLSENPTVLIDLDASEDLSVLRDGPYESSTATIGHTAGSGTITDETSEFKLSVTGAAGDEALLKTSARGRYQPGKSSLAGIGIRMGSDSVSGDTEALWGYFDRSSGVNPKNGFGWGLDNNGLFITRWVDGTKKACNEAGDTRVYEEDWNIRPDFFSERDVNPSDGMIYQVRYTYYGYGIIKWQVVYAAPGEEQQTAYTVHSFKVDGATSTDNPNVNITGLVTNPNGDDALDLFIGGRQYTVLGDYAPQVRTTGKTVQGKTIDAANASNPTPVMSFKRVSGRKEVAVQALSADVITNENLEFSIYVGADLTGDNFQEIQGQASDETAFQVDTSATNISTGTGARVRPSLMKGGDQNKEDVGQDIGNVRTDVPDGVNVTFCLRSITGASASAAMTGRMIEEW